MKKVLLLTSLSLLISLISCEINKEKDAPKIDGQIQFSLDLENHIGKKADLIDVSEIKFTIATVDGKPTKYTDAIAKVQWTGEKFICDLLPLSEGEYKLTYFVLFNEASRPIYASPTKNSNQGQNVENPLPIPFPVLPNERTAISVEVLSTENLTPEDFGYPHTSFSFKEIKTLSFKIGAAKEDSSEFLSAKITITNQDYSFSQMLRPIENNGIAVRTGFSDTYTITVKKAGFEAYVKDYQTDDLKSLTEPLLIPLKRATLPTDSLVAFYPFNGNAKDASVEGNHGDIVGKITSVPDRYGDPNSAFRFSGEHSYIDCKDPESLRMEKHYSISLWFYHDGSNQVAPFVQKRKNGSPYDMYSVGYGSNPYTPKASDDIIFLNIQDNNQSERKAITYTDPIPVGWNHLVIVNNSEGKARLYINSEKVASSVAGSGPTKVEGWNLFIGGSPYTGQFLNGSLDDIRIYSKKLSKEEISQLFLE